MDSTLQCPLAAAAVPTGPVTASTDTGGSTAKSATSSLEAECFNTKLGSLLCADSAESGEYPGCISNGDCAVYKNVDFGSGVSKFNARIAGFGGNIEIRIDTPQVPVHEFDTYKLVFY